MKILFRYLSSIDIPIVWVFHDCWSMTGHCAYFDYINCNKWKEQCKQCEQKKEYPGSLLIDRSRKNFIQKKELFTSVRNMTIVPVSYWLGDIVKQSFLKKYPIQVIQNGIDVNIFSPQNNTDLLREKLSINNKTFLLGVASPWGKRKGLKDFITLSTLIPESWKIVLVGLSKKQIKQLPEQIIGIERTENVQQLATFYSAADIFINPTWEDTFPTTNLESLACGTPIITYQTGGSVESVSVNTGYVVKKGDINGIISCVYKILETGKATYTEECRNRAVKHYNKSERFEDYIKLYNKLLEKL